MDNSPLKHLPLELRLDIYDKVLYAEEAVKVTLNQPVSDRNRLTREEHASEPHFLSLRSTCKQIAKEIAGTVFKINDSWTFAQTNDDSTVWGKRLRLWCHYAGEACLQRARHVQFDIGAWDSRPKSYPRGDIIMLLHYQIGSMYQNLPRQLRQCEQSFKLRIKWSSGVKLADGSRDRLNVVTLILPLWTDDLIIQSCVSDAASQANGGLLEYDYTWHVGSRDGKVPPFVDPPRYDQQLARKIAPERSTLMGLANEIGLGTCIALNASVRERLEEYAVNA